jgi:hypothetical protein
MARRSCWPLVTLTGGVALGSDEHPVEEPRFAVVDIVATMISERLVELVVEYLLCCNPCFRMIVKSCCGLSWSS